METIGVIGGMSWESSLEYYKLLNQMVKTKLGGLYSAEVLLHSLNFGLIEQMQVKGDWEGLGDILADSAVRLENAGADLLILATNTMHKLAPRIKSEISVPFLHIADAVAKAISEKKLNTVGLLGTKFTMNHDFYHKQLETYNIKTIVPLVKEQDIIHKVIYQELCLGQIDGKSRKQYLSIIDNLVRRGAQGVILGCTEIPMLISQCHTDVILFDSTRLHALAAVEMALT